MLERVEHSAVGEAQAQRGDLHPREHGTKRAGKGGVGEQRFEKTRDELDHLAIEQRAGARDKRQSVLLEPP